MLGDNMGMAPWKMKWTMPHAQVFIILGEQGNWEPILLNICRVTEAISSFNNQELPPSLLKKQFFP